MKRLRGIEPLLSSGQVDPLFCQLLQATANPINDRMRNPIETT